MATKTCENCGAVWAEPEPNETPYPFLRFSTEPSLDEHGEISLQLLFDEDPRILLCPKCPIPEVDEAMYRGSDRRTAGDEDDKKPRPPFSGPTHGG